MRLNNLAHELERLKVILAPSDQTYLGQLESSFNDACKTVSERTQEMRIRKLMLKKQSKLLECEDNVYESISWIEELLENVQILYQENCVGKNQLEAEELLSKCADIYKQAQLLSRVQGHLMDLARNQLTCSSKLETVLATGAKASAPYDQEKLNSATQDFRDAKTLGVQLLERLPKGFLQDDSGFTSPVVKEVSHLIRLKLYTLWLKLRELEYTVTGSNVPDNETVKELGIDTSYLDRRPQSTSAFYPRTRSSLDDGYRGSFLSVDENERRRRNQPIPYLDADDFFPLTGLPGREIRLPHKLPSTTTPTDMLRGAQTPDSVTRNKQRTSSRNGRASAESMESSKRAPKYRDNVKKLIDHVGHLMNDFRNRLSDLGTAVHEIPSTNFRELDKLKMMADGEFARVNARLHECCNECGDDPLGKEIIDRSGRDAGQLHRQWVAEWNAHLRGHGQISPNAGLLKRLQDLIFDLDECKRRLADLRNAVCYSTVEKAKMASIANDAKSSSLVLSCLITSDDINRVTVIHEEIVGMNNTLSAQEKFITDLLDQVRGDQRLVYQPQLLKIRQSWKEYRDELAIFDGFITYLEKAYKLLPRIEEFSSHQSRPKSYRKKISELTRSQAEGHRLQADIADLIRPDRLHPRAEEVGETCEVKPRVGWLVNHLKQKFRTVTALTDELDMLLTNLMTGLSLDEINGDLLLRNHSSTPVENGGMLTGTYRPSSATNNRIPSQSAPPFLDDPWSLTGYEGGISKIPARNPLDLAPPRPPRTASEMDGSMNPLDQQYPIKELTNGSVSNSSSWRIIQPLTDITCKVDDSVDFHCHFAGPTDVSLLGIEWTFQPFTYSIKEPFYGNKEHISKDTQQFTRLSDRNNARLKIRNVRVGQAGAYTVKIQNLKTGKTMKSTGMLKVRPDLLKTMENTAAQQLDPSSGLLTPVHFSVAYRGFTSIPIVEWRHDRHELNKKVWQIKTDETHTSISTRTAHLCDKGMYECYLRDPLTDMQLYSSAELKVDLVGNNAKNKNIPILITGDGGVSEAVHDGDPLTLKCPFRQPTNSTDYSVSWLQNGQTMYTFRPNATDTNRPVKTKEIQFQRGQTIWRFYIVENYCILSTNVVHRSDEGKYICRVKENGSVFENSATITVTILLEFAEALQRKSIINGREMDLLCCLKAPSQFLQDPKTIQINWFLNNRLLNPYRCIRLGISLTNDHGRLGLHVVKTTVEHAGTYCCEATLDDSTVRTQCDVEVLERSIPRIIKMTRIPSGSLTPNQTVTITYEYSGVPQPSCEWFKDNESIHPDGIHYKLEVFQKHCTLTIINVDTTDSGIYRIKLGNELGVAEATEIVTVTGLSENESEKTTSTIVRAIPFPGHQPLSENLSILSEPRGVHDTLSASASIFLIRPVDVQARVGENAHIFCLLKNLADPVTVFWYHNNELLKSGKGSSVRTYTNQPKRGFHRVELVNVSMACAGSYKVRVCKSNLTSAEVPNEVLADSVFTVAVKGKSKFENYSPLLLKRV
ncbi:unnamed protein product [Calicophoron daubneyi]|uniref:Ig-like domain-containing protein n=1 Tax=Calicophoron daubneyi TaxID=300641 RepID=A0AAV2TKJ6_CALDB